MLLRMLLALAFTLHASFAAAQQHVRTVLDLTGDCRPVLGAEIPNTVPSGFCAGVFYMVEGLTRLRDQSGRAVVGACLPERPHARLGQCVRSVVRKEPTAVQ